MANEEIALLGGGCFWCIEAVYTRTKGVHSAISGYAGGERPNPTYENVCSGATGHAEVVRIAFDPDIISFSEILDIFWTIHDPTTLNQQGADKGTQYRSVIFYLDASQRQTAEASILELQKKLDDPVVTELSEAPAFYPAESYHQDYFTHNPMQGYCQFVVAPKVQKFMTTYPERVIKR
jgi:peptide-methionine (S)-S-oxide reductase